MNRPLLTWLGSSALLLAVNNSANAASDEGEPIWVISWAVFYAFLAIALFLIGSSSKRKESLLNEEQEKEYENALIRKRSELYREAPQDEE